MTAADSVIEVLARRARNQPHAVAYSVDGEAVTCRQLLDDARRLAGRLADLGVGRETQCAIVLPASLDFIRVVYACQALAARPVAINPDLPTAAIARRLQLVRAGLAICDSNQAGRLATARLPCPVVVARDLATHSTAAPRPAATDPTEIAFLQLTSGTTGEPRAVAISHRSLVASLVATGDRLELRQGDVLATWVPLHHDLGLVRYVFGAMIWRCPSHLIRLATGNFRPWLALIDEVGATITGAPDSAYRLASRTVDPTGLDLRSLRFAGNGGESVRVGTIQAFEQRFGLSNVVRPAYGLAEATLTVTSSAPGEPLRIDDNGIVSCGRPIAGIDVRVVDSGGRDVPAGATGDILVRGTPVFSGYFDDDAATSHVLRDGWLDTGDVGSVDADGYLFVSARSRALIKRGGATIAPSEIENAVNGVEGVVASAVVGIVLSSASLTEDIVVVAEHDGACHDPDALRARVESAVRRSVGFAPGRVLVVPAGALPRAAAGKVQYEDLRRLVKEQIQGNAGGAER